MALFEKLCKCVPLKKDHSSDAADTFSEFGSYSSISDDNLLAFTSTTALVKNQGPVSRDKDWFIYIVDLNIPWEPFRVGTSVSGFSLLEWGPNCRLLAADKNGKLKVYGMKHSSINEWAELHVFEFADEDIISAGFFFNGKHMNILFEQRGGSWYHEKYRSKHMNATKRNFGGSSQDGIFVITGTNLMTLKCFNDDDQIETYSVMLGDVRLRIAHASFAYAKNGDILVCTAMVDVTQSARCFKVAFKPSGGASTKAVCENFGSFKAGVNSNEAFIVDVQFSQRNDPKSLIVISKSNGETLLQLFEVREKSSGVNMFFLKNMSVPPEPIFRTIEWVCEKQWRTTDQISCICMPLKSFISGQASFQFVVVASEKRMITVNLENMKEFGYYQDFSMSVDRTGFQSPQKKVKLEYDEVKPKSDVVGTINSCCLSPLGNILAVFDSNGALSLFRLPSILEQTLPSIQNAVLMLEYCLVSGINSWDILPGLKAGIVDAVCEKLWENYSLQPQHVQQFHYSRLLTLTLCLYRLVPALSHKAAYYSVLQTLYYVYSALKSFLRPIDLTNQERGPAENLTAILQTKVNEYGNDIDKVLPIDQTRSFTIDPNTLSTLQPIIQWVGNTVLRILASVPEGKQRGKGLLTEVWKDLKILNMFRELLVLIRTWGVFRPMCLPVFCRNESQDIVAKLFQLLTRLVVNPEIDEAFIDDCCQLQSQHLVPGIPIINPAIGIASPLLYQSSLPLEICFGDSPSYYQPFSKESISENVNWLEPPQCVDVVRQIYLGKSQPAAKQCSRCSGSTLLNGWARSAAIRSWEMRWTSHCPCGGMWLVQKPGCLVASG
ncbi:mediator of RNA polymerase II transcription subunit 16-like isoform X2 [Artemia franciscana]|uniref:mediator of RNA polymerase II transcription subunit 16-like isoform X2 n=1 Tax=Artemia franciscana TaxID=6661 RepID=UPI0032DB8C3E